MAVMTNFMEKIITHSNKLVISQIVKKKKKKKKVRINHFLFTQRDAPSAPSKVNSVLSPCSFRRGPEGQLLLAKLERPFSNSKMFHCQQLATGLACRPLRMEVWQ